MMPAFMFFAFITFSLKLRRLLRQPLIIDKVVERMLSGFDLLRTSLEHPDTQSRKHHQDQQQHDVARHQIRFTAGNGASESSHCIAERQEWIDICYKISGNFDRVCSR